MDITDTICETYENNDIRTIIIDLILLTTKMNDNDKDFRSMYGRGLTIINKQSVTGMVSYLLCNLIKNHTFEEISINNDLLKQVMNNNIQLYNLILKYNTNVEELSKMRDCINTIINVFAKLFSKKYDILECINDNGYIIENDIVMLDKISEFIENTLLSLAYSVYDCNFSKNNDFIDRLTTIDHTKDNNHLIQEMINRLSGSVELFSIDFFKYFDIKAISINKFLKYSFEKKVKYFIDTSISVKNIFFSISKYINIYINTTLGLMIYLTSKEECMLLYPEISNKINNIGNKINKEKQIIFENIKLSTKPEIIREINMEDENIFNDELEQDFTSMAVCLTDNQNIDIDDNEFDNNDSFID